MDRAAAYEKLILPDATVASSASSPRTKFAACEGVRPWYVFFLLLFLLIRVICKGL
jgi:hypothetical protein